ncbi:WD40 repeat-like protein [Suillus weaverae]|nr:WD40 repeat-like protein [Suillus weaverae]
MSGVLDVAKQVYLSVRRRATPAQTTKTASSRTIRWHTSAVSAVAFFKDGRHVVTGSRNLRIWDVQTRELLERPFEGHKDWVRSVDVSSDNKRIASGGKDTTIIVWDVETRQMVFEPLVKHTGWVNSVCFSPDGRKLASGSLDSMIVLWDMETGAVLTILHGHSSWVLSVAFSPDGLKLASGGSLDGTIQVWRTDNAELLLEIKAHENLITSVVWSHDGQQLVSASSDHAVKFCNSSNGDQIGEPCIGHTDSIDSLATSSDGSFVATSSSDKTVRLWSTKSHQQIGQAFEHTARVCFAAISPNGDVLVSGDDEGKVQLWSIESILAAAFALDSSYDSFFAHRSKAKLGRYLYPEALSDAEMVIELNPSSYRGYELKHAALHGAQRYDEAIEAFHIMLSKLDDAPDPRIRQLRQQYVSPSEAYDTIRRAIDAHLENAPLRLVHTFTGHLCDRQAQLDAFMTSTEYKEILSSSTTPLHMESITGAVSKYFSWVMLSHRWKSKEPRLFDIQDKDLYTLDPVGAMVKLQKFCAVARDAGYRWAWSDTCCIDQNNNVELQESVNSMFIWYRHSALTIIYLSDVRTSSKCGALARSTWNTRGWTLQEYLAPNIVLFYKADWTLYLDDRSPNHKESFAIMQELEGATGIHARALVAFRPGMRDAREKLRWASSRVTTLQEDIAYSLFGIFGVYLPVIYGEKKQNALGRLLQEIIAHSGDITALDWVGKSSKFNSCLPADITAYKAPPCRLPSLSEDEMQISVSALRNTVALEAASELYTLLDNLSAPRFANTRLQLPCITFLVTEVRRRRCQNLQSCFTYDVKSNGLQDLLITTEDKLAQFSRTKPTQQTFLLVRPWNRHDLGLPDFADDAYSTNESEPESLLDDSPSDSPSENEMFDLGSQSLRLIVSLGQPPFGVLLLAQQRGGEYKRIASDHNITAQVKHMASVHDMMNVRTLEIL